MPCCPENTIVPINCVESAAQDLLIKLDLQSIINLQTQSLSLVPIELQTPIKKGIATNQAIEQLLQAISTSNYCTPISGGSGSDGILDGGFRLIGVGLLDGGFRV